MKFRILALFSILLLAAAGGAVWFFVFRKEKPVLDTPALYLTWSKDPTTTVNVNWLANEPGEIAPFVFFREKSSETWRRAGGEARPFPHTGQTINHVALTGLKPGTTYEFVTSGPQQPDTFATLPATLEKPLRFVEGGDAGDGDFALMDRMNQVAGKLDPSFVVIGGDIAYCNGDPAKAGRWTRFFQSLHRHLRTPDGRLVPLVITIGNHEVNLSGKARWAENLPKEREAREKLSACFQAAFPFPGDPDYGVLDVGNYLTLLLLDSEHLSPVDGAQTEWLARTLDERRGRPHIFPVYHVPAYPSQGEFDHRTSTAIRKHWIPLFEAAGVRLAFEHHNHTFKITRPILDGKVDPAGIVYVGDGAWGVVPRKTHVVEETWYLEKAGSINHLHEVILEPGRRTLNSISIDGETLHTLTQQTPPAPAVQ
jgi:hypothetical protein